MWYEYASGQFCVLASDNDEIVERSIEEFEYLLTDDGWALQTTDFKCNITSGRGPTTHQQKTIRSEKNNYNCTTKTGALTAPITRHLRQNRHTHATVVVNTYNQPTIDTRIMDSWRVCVRYTLQRIREDYIVDL